MMGIKTCSPDSWPSSPCTKPQVCCLFADEAIQRSLEGIPLARGGWTHTGRLPERHLESQSKDQWCPGSLSEHFWIWFRKYVVSKYIMGYWVTYFECQATSHLWVISSPACPSPTECNANKISHCNVFKGMLSFEFLGNARTLKWHEWQSKGGGRDQVLELGIGIYSDCKFQPLDKSWKRENHWGFPPCTQGPMFPQFNSGFSGWWILPHLKLQTSLGLS